MEEQNSKIEMIELNIKMNEIMNYNICIPSLITPETFPEVLKRLKSVVSIIPKEDTTPCTKGKANPVLRLNEDESKEIFQKYKTNAPEAFRKYLSDNYKLEYDNRSTIVALMGRVRKRIAEMEKKK